MSVVRTNSRGSDSGSGDEMSTILMSHLNINKQGASDSTTNNQVVLARSRLLSRSKSTSEKTNNVQIKGSKTTYTAGRPPWYTSNGQMKEAFVVGLCGGSASGKTTVAKKIIEELNVPWVSLLSMDSFYKELTDEQQELASRSEFDFDHPDAFDFDLILKTIRDLKQGKLCSSCCEIWGLQ